MNERIYVELNIVTQAFLKFDSLSFSTFVIPSNNFSGFLSGSRLSKELFGVVQQTRQLQVNWLTARHDVAQKKRVPFAPRNFCHSEHFGSLFLHSRHITSASSLFWNHITFSAISRIPYPVVNLTESRHSSTSTKRRQYQVNRHDDHAYSDQPPPFPIRPRHSIRHGPVRLP
jgi:hypothetical protein